MLMEIEEDIPSKISEETAKKIKFELGKLKNKGLEGKKFSEELLKKINIWEKIDHAVDLRMQTDDDSRMESGKILEQLRADVTNYFSSNKIKSFVRKLSGADLGSHEKRYQDVTLLLAAHQIALASTDEKIVSFREEVSEHIARQERIAQWRQDMAAQRR